MPHDYSLVSANKDEFLVEFAVSGRAQCKFCKQTIAEGEPRISRTTVFMGRGAGSRGSSSASDEHLTLRWYHVENRQGETCFFDSFDKARFSTFQPSKLADFTFVGTPAQQAKLKKLIQARLPGFAAAQHERARRSSSSSKFASAKKAPASIRAGQLVSEVLRLGFGSCRLEAAVSEVASIASRLSRRSSGRVPQSSKRAVARLGSVVASVRRSAGSKTRKSSRGASSRKSSRGAGSRKSTSSRKTAHSRKSTHSKKSTRGSSHSSSVASYRVNTHSGGAGRATTTPFLTDTRAGHNKFWYGKVAGNKLTTYYGSLSPGSAVRQNTKTLPHSQALEALATLMQSKINKGYVVS